MAKGQADRLQSAVFKALRIIEDTDLDHAELAAVVKLAETLLEELRQLRGRRRGDRLARTANP